MCWTQDVLPIREYRSAYGYHGGLDFMGALRSRVVAAAGGPDPEVYAAWAIFAERAGLSQFGCKWEACCIDDWEV